MISKYVLWLIATVISGLVLPFIVLACTLWLLNLLSTPLLVTFGALLIVFVFCSVQSVQKLAARHMPLLEEQCTRQIEYLDSFAGPKLNAAIAGSAAISLFLELSMIRWQAAVFEVFAFYKNFGLLACLAGLGTGYALAALPRLPLILCIPAIGMQILLFFGTRYGLNLLGRSVITTPITDQVNMGLAASTTIPELVAVYCLLTVTFLFTVLAFIPVGQLCGRLMAKGNPLSAYGFNLLGSLLGIVLITLLSYVSTPPAVWFGLAFLGISAFVATKRDLMITLGTGIASLIVLSWPVHFGHEVVFSPYQVLERTTEAHGWSMIRAAGHYYQRMQDLSKQARAAFPDLDYKGSYYDLPYTVNPGAKTIAVLGAGTGNDVAAALRSQATEVDAVEIDPAILALGTMHHPEKPYSDKRVTAIVNDARAHLRSTQKHYDMIVFGLIDSHSMASHASSLRIDSYVYTVEALKEARSHLTDHGVLSLSFSVAAPQLAKKFYLMMTEAFGTPPVCLRPTEEYDGSITFLQNKEGNLQVSDDIVKGAHLMNVTERVAKSDPPSCSLSTDDWPFIYMVNRKWPVSYIPMILLVIGVTYAFNRTLGNQSGSLKDMDFFMLGAGFMLIEAKAITELGLVFGNTWYVIAIVISAIIGMAYIANLLVEKLHFNKTGLAYLLMIVALGAGLYAAFQGGFASDATGRIASTLMLTCPLMFSGVVFSSLISRCQSVPRAMSMNLMGAMLGGVLEYNAMYFGYRALYVVAIVIYILAFVFSRLRKDELPAGANVVDGSA